MVMVERPFYDLLPELYKSDALLDAILATFEEQYLKLEKTIDDLPDALYNHARATDEFIDYIWEMFGIESCDKIFSRKQKRELIPLIYTLQRQKGTRRALEWLLKAFLSDLCGYWVSPVIMEYDSWCDYNCSEQLMQLYFDRFGGEDSFVVLIPPEPALQAQDAKDRIRMLIEEYSPADTVFQLIVPKPKTVLGQDSYLGYAALL